MLSRLQPWLEAYPNRPMAELLLSGFQVGFPVPEYLGPGCFWVKNSRSVYFNMDIVRSKLEAELREGRMEGPFSSPPFPNFRLSPLSIVPKKEPGSYRLIHNLSYPEKSSLNDCTDKSNASVQYATFDDALSLLRKFGCGALMAKADIKSAFRLLPIHPCGFNSLGFQFDDQYYFDKSLPMGFTLSCYYFEAFSTFLNWVVDREIGNTGSMHYLDDFLFIGSALSDDCLLALSKFSFIMDYFGVPLAKEKTVFPCTTIEFLGITIDSVLMEFSLPSNKISRLKNLIVKLLASKKSTLREIQSLLGLLNFTSRVIPMGRAFTKRLYRATCGVKSPFAHIRLTRHIKEDFKIWLQFLDQFNGHSIWQDEFVSAESLNLFTDAAGAIGYGAFLPRTLVRRKMA